MLLVLFSAITIVLSCANLSGLLLARWSTREVDLAVQAALGASNGRLVSQVVGESLALSMIAVVLSAPLALWSAKSLTLLLWNNPDASSPWTSVPITESGYDGRAGQPRRVVRESVAGRSCLVREAQADAAGLAACPAAA